MDTAEVLVQQLIIGLSNGMIIALIALGYTMVYGLVELINFAHGDLFMLGGFCALTILGGLGLAPLPSASEVGTVMWWTSFVLLFTLVPLFCGALNWLIDRLAYRPLRNAPRLVPLVSALGVSFILLNVGLFWGGLPMSAFDMGASAASPKDFPQLVSNTNLLGESSFILLSPKDLLVMSVTLPLLLILVLVVTRTQFGRAMRAVAQNPVAARLVGIDVDRIISLTFVLGGALAGVASIIYALYNNTVFFQMGYRVGIDAFTAAVLGGIGNLVGSVVGGILIGLIRAMSDQYISTEWTNTIVFMILIGVLIFRPAGLLGRAVKEKV
jgi:branched-chain amino acid transport system permease protein